MSTAIWEVGCQVLGIYREQESEMGQMGKGLLVGWLYEPKIPTNFLKAHYIDVINFSKRNQCKLLLSDPQVLYLKL